MLEDFRSVRRWLVLLGSIAILAIGLAAYALVKAYESDDEAAQRERVVRLERNLDARLAELRAAIDRAGRESDITRLQREINRLQRNVGRKANARQLVRVEGRLQALSDDTAAALDAARDASRDVSALTDRVEVLESRPGR